VTIFILVAGGALLLLAALRMTISNLRDAPPSQPRKGITKQMLVEDTAPRRERPAEPIRTDNSLAWLLVALPLLAPIVIAGVYLSKTDLNSDLVLVVSLAVTIALVVLDQRLLKARGVQVSGPWAALVVPFYFVDRARVTGQTYALAAAWVIAAVVGITAGVAVDRTMGPVDVTREGVQAGLEAAVSGEGAFCSMTPPVWVDDTFNCVVEVDGQEAAYQLTIVDHDGRFTYRPG
jgi:hypothetical protein